MNLFNLKNKRRNSQEERKISKLETNDSNFNNSRNKPENPFLDPTTSEWWFNSFSKAQYENLLHYDPELTWTKKEEKKLLRKLNLTVLLMVSLMFFGFHLSKASLADAIRSGMAYDVDMKSSQYIIEDGSLASGYEPDVGRYYSGASYGVALTVQTDLQKILYAERSCQIIMAIPSVLVAKKIGPHIWLPIIMCIYCALGALCSLINSTSTAIGIRATMGAIGAGFIPSCVLYLSYFFTSDQLAMRLTCLWVLKTFAEIVSGYVAYATIRINLAPKPYLTNGWELLFVVEGVVPLAGAIIIGFFLPPSLTEKKKWQRELLTEHEKQIQVNSILRDDPSKGLTSRRKHVSILELLKSILDFDLYPIYFISLLAFIPFDTYETYLLLCIRQFSGINDSIARYSFRMPWRILHMVLLVLITKVSEKLKERTIISLVFPLWQLPLLGVMTWWSGTVYEEWESALVVSLALAAPNIIAILQSWVSRNSASTGKRAISAAIFMMFIDAGYMASSVVYKTSQLPTLKDGNLSLFIIMLVLVVLMVLTKVYYVVRNKMKKNKWNKLSEREQMSYLETKGWKDNKTGFYQLAH